MRKTQKSNDAVSMDTKATNINQNVFLGLFTSFVLVFNNCDQPRLRTLMYINDLLDLILIMNDAVKETDQN